MEVCRVEIPLKLMSCNDYINACRINRYVGAKRKAELEEQIMWYLRDLPCFEKPVTIHFHWIESNKKRDLDGIAFGKKFILDAMVKANLIKDDNRRFVTGFTDSFDYGPETKVILEIKEIEDEQRLDSPT